MSCYQPKINSYRTHICTDSSLSVPAAQTAWLYCSVSCKPWPPACKLRDEPSLKHTHTHAHTDRHVGFEEDDIFHREKRPNGRCQGPSVSRVALEGRRAGGRAHINCSCQCEAHLKRAKPHRHSRQSGSRNRLQLCRAHTNTHADPYYIHGMSQRLIAQVRRTTESVEDGRRVARGPPSEDSRRRAAAALGDEAGR